MAAKKDGALDPASPPSEDVDDDSESLVELKLPRTSLFKGVWWAS